MGRRRIVRTPSEEREHQLRRKEMRRARIRAQTDEQRAIARAKHAELQRRRRQNAALREREAADRRRRREDPEVRQLEAAKHRARREIEAVRLREAEVRRLHRQNAAVRQRDAEAQRARRREDAALRRREAEARRRRRQDPEVRQLEAAKHRLRRQDAAVRQREAEARRRHRERAALRQRAALEREEFVCDVCFRPAELSSIRMSHVPMLTAEYPSEDVPSFMLCPSCQGDLRMGAIPPLPRSNSNAYPANPAELCEYHSLCSSDYEDSQCLQRLARRLNSERNTQESKVDCCLQTDGTGKVDCFAQTEDAAKISFEVPSKKCLKVAEVQTEDSTWLQYPESSSDESDYGSDYLLAHKGNMKIVCRNKEGGTL